MGYKKLPASRKRGSIEFRSESICLGGLLLLFPKTTSLITMHGHHSIFACRRPISPASPTRLSRLLMSVLGKPRAPPSHSALPIQRHCDWSGTCLISSQRNAAPTMSTKPDSFALPVYILVSATSTSACLLTSLKATSNSSVIRMLRHPGEPDAQVGPGIWTHVLSVSPGYSYGRSVMF